MIIVFLGKNRFSPVLCRFIYTKISLSEKNDTKAVTREEPFQSVLIYTIGNNLHPLDVNKVQKYTFWKGTSKKEWGLYSILNSVFLWLSGRALC